VLLHFPYEVLTSPPFSPSSPLFLNAIIKQLFVPIDEYDVSINKALGNRDFVSALQVPNRNPLQRMENMCAEFFSKVKTACDDNVARCFITGVTSLALNEFTSGFNIATHITNDLRFASLYGFTEADVRKDSRDSNCRKQWQQGLSSLGGGITTAITSIPNRKWLSIILTECSTGFNSWRRL